uniref:Glycosyltransferase RgtA/B/C/D-like domain-containing protein n=1 Tax=Desulfovibrio sp. U5L TaxID=596152 RepID=I2PWP3_9BACT
MTLPKPARLLSSPDLAASLAVALAQFLFMVHCLGPGLVSSYPGIEYDGFDWVLQGLYLKALFSGTAGAPLPCLRAPGFVLVTALDAWTGSGGIVVAAVLCLAHFLSLAALLSIWRRLGLSGGQQAALFLAAVLSPYAYFRGFILSDPVAMAGMLVSIRLLLEWFIDRNGRAFAAAAAAGFVAGLTQLYGVLPFLVGAALAVWRDGAAGRRIAPRVLATTGTVGLLALVLWAWNAAIPHQKVPIQFELLRLSTHMAGFYANVWAWYFGFLAPVAGVLAVAFLARRPRPSPATVFLAATSATFVGLLFFYQSEEARFSWYYFPLALCLAATGLAWLDRAGWGKAGRATLAASLLLLAGQSLLVTPPDYWQPRLADARFDPGDTWLAMFLRAGPVDRLDLANRCGAPGAWCEKARLPSHIEADERRLVAAYLRLRLAEAQSQGPAGTPGPATPPPDRPGEASGEDEAVWVEDWR